MVFDRAQHYTAITWAESEINIAGCEDGFRLIAGQSATPVSGTAT
jgi:hypothetical protein